MRDDLEIILEIHCLDESFVLSCFVLNTLIEMCDFIAFSENRS